MVCGPRICQVLILLCSHELQAPEYFGTTKPLWNPWICWNLWRWSFKGFGRFFGGRSTKTSRGYVKGNLTYNLLITFRHIKMEAKKRMAANGMKIWMEGSFKGYRFYTLEIWPPNSMLHFKKESLGEKKPSKAVNFPSRLSTTHGSVKNDEQVLLKNKNHKWLLASLGIWCDENRVHEGLDVNLFSTFWGMQAPLATLEISSCLPVLG